MLTVCYAATEGVSGTSIITTANTALRADGALIVEPTGGSAPPRAQRLNP